MIKELKQELRTYFHKHIDDKGLEVDLLDINKDIMDMLERYENSEKCSDNVAEKMERVCKAYDELPMTEVFKTLNAKQFQQLDKAHKILREQYVKAVKLGHIQKPLAYALYTTWTYFDREGM